MYSKKLVIEPMSEEDLEVVVDMQTRSYDPLFHKRRETFLKSLSSFQRDVGLLI